MAVPQRRAIGLQPQYIESVRDPSSTMPNRPRVVMAVLPLELYRQGEEQYTDPSRFRQLADKALSFVHMTLHPAETIVKPSIEQFHAIGTPMDSIENNSDVYGIKRGQ